MKMLCQLLSIILSLFVAYEGTEAQIQLPNSLEDLNLPQLVSTAYRYYMGVKYIYCANCQDPQVKQKGEEFLQCMDSTIPEASEARTLKDQPSSTPDKCTAAVQQVFVRAILANPLKAFYAYSSCLPPVKYISFEKCSKSKSGSSYLG